MIYLHEPIIVKPGMVDEYVWAVGRYCVPEWTKYVNVVGAFKNFCHYNEAIFVWEYLAGAEGIDACGAYALVDREGKAWQRLAEKYRENWHSQWVESVPFSPTAVTIKKRQKKGDFVGNSIYYWELTKVLPGKVDEYLEAMEKELVPMEEKRGMKLAGCYRWFSGCGEPNEIRSFWSVKNWDHWGKILEQRAKDRSFQRWLEKAMSLRTEWSYTFWVPAEWSLLK